MTCNDDTFSGRQAPVTFDAIGATTYLVQAGSYGDGPAGKFADRLREDEAVERQAGDAALPGA